MKTERWLCGLWAFFLAFAAAFGGMGSMVSGFGLGENMLLLALILALAAAICALACLFRLYLLPLGGLLAVCAIFWKKLLPSARYFVSFVCRFYDMAYDCGVPQWPEEAVVGDSAMWILAVLGCCMICLVTTAVLSGRGLAVSGIACLIPLVPCVVVTNTVPEVGYLFLVLVSLVLLVLASRVRVDSLKKGNTLLLYLLLPVLAGVGLLFALMPRESYAGQVGAQKLEALTIQLWEDIDWTLPGYGESVPEKTASSVDLSQVGPNPKLGLRVMNVKADTSGNIYLRGSSYDTYTGTGWTASGKEAGNDAQYSGKGASHYAMIQTFRVQDILYYTYMHSWLDSPLENGQLPNTDQKKEYTVEYQEPIAYDPTWDTPHPDFYGEFGEVYLQLPFETRKWATQWLPQEVLALQQSGQIYAAACTIGQLVRELAVYDRMTEAMPAGETDFARWFAEKGQSGYCTHFATTAAVLLRAAGIPARYVTGYLAQTQADLYAKVTTDEAHAWVEYYINGIGWQVLEATPPAEASPVLPENIPAVPTVPPTEATLPTETQPVATQPTETLPAESTAPSQVTEPGLTTDATQPGSTPIPGTVPSVPDAGWEAPARDELPDWVKTILRMLGWTACALAGILLQWQLRLRLRKLRRRRRRNSQQLLAGWQEVEQICKLLKCPPPEPLHRLALQAKFSQHGITKAELREFYTGLEKLIAQLKQKSLWQQWIYRLVFAIY